MLTKQTSYDKLLESGQYGENPEIDGFPVKALIKRWENHKYLTAPVQRRMYESIAKLITGLTVCDAGSGPGLGSLILAQEAKSVVGVEKIAVGVQFASRCYPVKNLEFVCSDVTEFSPGFFFDAIIAVELIEHVEDYHKMLATFQRLLADGGSLYISSPNRNWPGTGQTKPKNYHHVREWTIGEFHEILSLYFCNVAFYDHGLEAQLEMDATLTPVLAICRK